MGANGRRLGFQAIGAPSVFDKSVGDEFRKQGHEFYGAMLCTLREADQFDFDEKVFRAWTAGEGVACRLPHAVHTPMLEWPRTGKFWEINVTKTPRIESIQETSFKRRLIGIEKNATFTTNPANVNAPAKIFEADDDLEERIESGDAVWCYFRLYLFPWQKRNTATQAKRRITALSMSLRSQADKLIQILSENQGLRPPQGKLPNTQAALDFDANDSNFNVLRALHSQWAGH